MTERRIAFRDRVTAELLGALSAAVNVLPPEMNIVGYEPHDAYVPVQWRHGRQAYDSREPGWVHYEGAQSPGRTPKHYGKIAISAVDRDLLERHLNRYEGSSKPAVAYRLNTTIMVGTAVLDRELFGLASPDAEDYQFAMRLGEGPLDIRVGADVLGATDRGFMPLSIGVRSGEVMNLADLPPNVPLL